jgi:YD repeat-containing protein
VVKLAGRATCLSLVLLFSLSSSSAGFIKQTHAHGNLSESSASADGDTNDVSRGGIKEEIPARFQKRYQEWKTELLSTGVGYQQWQSYAQDSTFTLTIAERNSNGGETGKYKWDESGKLIAATITLGHRIDHGYPNAVYYPVMNSLETQTRDHVRESVLAATKIAHEFGHLKQMRTTSEPLYRLQNQLVPLYNSILLTNGYNTKDPKLIALAERMGGTPVQLWEDREYWGEANAMLFLRDRFANEGFRCTLFRRIKESVELYARDYADRFEQVAQSAGSSRSCEGR